MDKTKAPEQRKRNKNIYVLDGFDGLYGCSKKLTTIYKTVKKWHPDAVSIGTIRKHLREGRCFLIEDKEREIETRIHKTIILID